MGPNEEQLYTAQLKQRKKRYGAQSREQSFCPISMTFKRCDLEDKIK